MSEKPITEFEVERRYAAGEFAIHADRRQTAFVALHSGLSHKGGHIQWIMSPAAAKALAQELLKAVEFASVPTLAERYPKKKDVQSETVLVGTTGPNI